MSATTMPPPTAPPMPPPMYGMPPTGYAMPVPHTATPIAGGVLLIVAGILGAIGGVVTMMFSSALFFFPGLETLLLVCGLLQIIFGAFALIGGVMGIQRKMWGLALVGGILGIFAIGPYALASILSLIGLILIAVSKQEFS